MKRKKSRSETQRDAKAPKVIQPPPEIAAAIDRITGEDRDWFKAHPGAESRFRPAAPNEFWPVHSSDCVRQVLVTQVWPGFRLRMPLLRLNLPESDRIQ
jgi:hypothetical protein